MTFDVARQSLSRTTGGAVPPTVRKVLNGPGEQLDAGMRSAMEPRFGHDFSRVRIHTDARAAESARAIDASAYAAGNDIVLDPESYAPGTPAHVGLLTHELAHVVQQRAAGPAPPGVLRFSTAHEEAGADRARDAVAAGRPAPYLPPAPFSIARSRADRPSTTAEGHPGGAPRHRPMG